MVPMSFTRQSRAMTLSETLIAAAGLGLLLVVAALGISRIRSDLKHQQVQELLSALDDALFAYHDATGEWPTEAGAGQGDRSPWSGDAARDHGLRAAEKVIQALTTLPASRSVLERVPGVLRIGEQDAGDGRWESVQDSWGHPLHCLTAASPSESDRQLVEANGGRPVFVSAGPDGRFGTDDPAARADNVFPHPSPTR